MDRVSAAHSPQPVVSSVPPVIDLRRIIDVRFEFNEKIFHAIERICRTDIANPPVAARAPLGSLVVEIYACFKLYQQ
jgi:hypothetical protein